jgi:hypothetical protein
MWYNVEVHFDGGLTLSQEADSPEEAIELVKERVGREMPAGTQWSDVWFAGIEEVK